MDPSDPTTTTDAVMTADDSAPVAVNGNGVSNNNNGNEDGGGGAKDYEELFPSLPASAAPAAGNSIGEWSRKPKLQSSTITQVSECWA